MAVGKRIEMIRTDTFRDSMEMNVFLSLCLKSLVS